MANFFTLPRELRDQIYELGLLHHEPLNPWEDSCYNQRQELTLGLLLVSKTVHHEASSLFYAQNRFDFTTATSEDVAPFLGTIGRNAEYIRHIVVDVPQFICLDPGDVALEDGDVKILANILDGCANLRMLTISLSSANTVELELDALDHPKIVAEALQLVDTHFRAIPSLEEIIVELFENCPNDDIRRRMESLGWTVSTAENMNVDEYYGHRSDGLYDGYGYDKDGYDDDDYDDEEYDIDNDSDFWRRAQD